MLPFEMDKVFFESIRRSSGARSSSHRGQQLTGTGRKRTIRREQGLERVQIIRMRGRIIFLDGRRARTGMNE
jgi:hypothetical protein